ncbi:MAG TPA: hypothetical protein VFR78_24415 [Pyrinomonadaceae bacterium]|nr:hypothetical protein [Pyrinomonadaceae bacterium]
MSDLNEVIAAANQLNEQKQDDEALLVLIGMREKALAAEPALKDDPNLEVAYEETTMGPLDDLKRLGKRVLTRWNKEIYGICCSNETLDSKERAAVLNSLNLGEAAVIAAVAGVLISMGVGAAIAAPLAPLIVRRFIWPAKDELCVAWRESIDAEE